MLPRYLGLLQRVGPGAASPVGVMIPVLALGFRLPSKGYRPAALGWLGAALAIAGNALILRPRVQAVRSAARAGE